ncbi:MAG: ankyrin repeat domain-containing protein [Rhizobiaceae bacterium]
MHKIILLTLALSLLGQGVVAGELIKAARSGDVAQVQQLLADGADVNETDRFGTALHFAAIGNHIGVVEVLVAHGAEVNAKSKILGTPLHAAANRNQAHAAEKLVQLGANADARNKDGYTPLQLAAKLGGADVARSLIKAGVDVNTVTSGWGDNAYKLGELTALHLARLTDNRDIVEMLRAAGAGPTPIQTSTQVLASASAQNGRKLAKVYCRTCHALEAGDPEPAAFDRGPPLIGIWGQQVGRDASFKYSQALREFDGEWTNDRLYSFILQPMLTVPGTLMGHQLVNKPDEIADITAYLISLAQ